jgi:hypothetical protein
MESDAARLGENSRSNGKGEVTWALLRSISKSR